MESCNSMQSFVSMATGLSSLVTMIRLHTKNKQLFPCAKLKRILFETYSRKIGEKIHLNGQLPQIV